MGLGSLLVLLEREIDYTTVAILKLQCERLKLIEVNKEAVEDYNEYLEVSSR
jgi:hypothetical protein